MEEEIFDLDDLKNVNVEEVDTNSLVDIRDVKINTDLPAEERIKDFIRQIKNPYCFKYDKMVVKLNFEETDITFEDRIKDYLSLL